MQWHYLFISYLLLFITKLLAAKQAAKQKSALEQQQVIQKKIDIQKKKQGLMKNLVDQQKVIFHRIK